MEKSIEERVKSLEKKVLVMEGGNPTKSESPYAVNSTKEIVRDK